MNAEATRNRIVKAADRLFYEQGFEHTSFADIANEVGISRGNFYYHFKTKDEMLDAVIERRLSDRQSMLDHWEMEGETPSDRIKSFINTLVMNQSKIMKYGCPIGTLCAELAKLNHASQQSANELFTLFQSWLARQFNLLGCLDDADALAMHLLSRSQGVATLANAFRDPQFVQSEVRQMHEWLDAVSPGSP